MTRKELATQLYRLNIQRGVLWESEKCTEKKWVSNVLNGVGAMKPMKKEQLIQAVAWAKEDLIKE